MVNHILVVQNKKENEILQEKMGKWKNTKSIHENPWVRKFMLQKK